jgi:sugar phosphate isomerase/epimerase
MLHLTRRMFGKSVLAGAFAASVARAADVPQARTGGTVGETKKSRHPIRLGGPVFEKTEDFEQLAAAHVKLGYRAAYCPGNVSLDKPDQVVAARKAFAKYDVVIAEVGRWVNLLDPDAERRAKHLKLVTDGLALAEAVGALCCVDIAGSYNPRPEHWYGPHPNNLSRKFFDATVENARKIIDAVKPTRAKLCFEMMGWALPDSPDSYLELIKAIDRKAFGVHVDICNLINSPARYYRNTDLINETFDKLGPYIVSCHAKDLAWDVEMNVHFREVPVGRGGVDFTTYLRRLARLDQDAPLMIEHCANAQEYDNARQFIQTLGPAVGVSFS